MPCCCFNVWLLKRTRWWHADAELLGGYYYCWWINSTVKNMPWFQKRKFKPKKKIEKKKANVVTNDLTYSEAHTALCKFFKAFQSLLFMTEISFWIILTLLSENDIFLLFISILSKHFVTLLSSLSKLFKNLGVFGHSPKLSSVICL